MAKFLVALALLVPPFGFHLNNRWRLTFMKLDAIIVAVSPTSVWRALGQAGLLSK